MFKETAFLGSQSSSNTGSVVSFSKKTSEGVLNFVEITGDTGKIRISQTNDESVEDFVCNLLVLRNVLDNFTKYLLDEKKKG